MKITLTPAMVAELSHELKQFNSVTEIHLEPYNGSTVRATLDNGYGTLRLLVNRNGKVWQEGGLAAQ